MTTPETPNSIPSSAEISERFLAAKAIQIGQAIVPYAAKNGTLPAGWALPGGARTTCEDTARAFAHNIHAAMQEQAQRIAANQRSAA